MPKQMYVSRFLTVGDEKFEETIEYLKKVYKNKRILIAYEVAKIEPKEQMLFDAGLNVVDHASKKVYTVAIGAQKSAGKSGKGKPTDPNSL